VRAPLKKLLAVDKREDGVVYGSATARRPKTAPTPSAAATRPSQRKPRA
jgi:hypothetical protein